jgi:hypothetical protein
VPEYLKGNVQQILREVDSRLKQSGLLNWRLGSSFYLILKGHHHKRCIKPFSAASAKLIDFVWFK